MKYSSRYFMPIPYHGFEPDLNISRVYLFVIKRPLQKGAIPLLFNPSYKEKIDLAYQFSNDPDFSLNDLDKNQKLFSVYTNQEFKDIKITDIIKWANKSHNNLINPTGR
jgi:hypothetical protein